jgi:hypothetical protein
MTYYEVLLFIPSSLAVLVLGILLTIEGPWSLFFARVTAAAIAAGAWNLRAASPEPAAAG